jgi:hypothetical protein
MIRRGWAAVPLPERRGPPCRGPDCYTRNGPCHPGCTPDARAIQHIPVPSSSEQVESTSESPGSQWYVRARRLVGWVLLIASMITALITIIHGVQGLIMLISTVP